MCFLPRRCPIRNPWQPFSATKNEPMMHRTDAGYETMQTIESIKGSIQTADDLHSVVKSMKALAAVNIRQFEKAVESLAEYNRTVEMGLHILLRYKPGVMSQAKPAVMDRLGAVVFGSDQGMCGQLNDQIVSHAVKILEHTGVKLADRTLLAVGLRVAGRLEDTGHSVEEYLSVPNSKGGITASVQDLVMIMEEWHVKKNIDRIVLFYSKHLSGASYRPHALDLLPVNEKWLRDIEQRDWPTQRLPIFTMEWDQLFSRLMHHYLFVSIYRAFAESLASENASRLASMQGAEKNIEERLGELSTRYHRQRQMSITEELLDIISGFSALEFD